MDGITTLAFPQTQRLGDASPGRAAGRPGAGGPGEYLDAGGFCRVYKVRDAGTGHTYALKCLNPQPRWSALMRQRALESLAREGALLASLDHPRIPEVYPYDLSQGIAMRFIPGVSLQRRLRTRGGPLPAGEALRYARAICDVLVYLHGRQPAPIIHGDIKPANVMVDQTGAAWVIDFGLAQAWQPAHASAVSELMMGTPGYTPHEQWLGAAEPRSDVYALGATLYELLTGARPPARGMDSRALRRHGPGVRPDLGRWIVAALAPTAAERPTARESCDALDAVISAWA